MKIPGFEQWGKTPRDNPDSVAGSRLAADDDLILRFIVVTADEEFYLSLEQIAGTCEWRIWRAVSVDEAEALIEAKPTAMVCIRP
jgi:hypothetical protein